MGTWGKWKLSILSAMFCYELENAVKKKAYLLKGGKSIHWACYYHVLKQDTATLKIKTKTEVTQYGYYPPNWTIWKCIKQRIWITYFGKKITDKKKWIFYNYKQGFTTIGNKTALSIYLKVSILTLNQKSCLIWES